MKFIILFSFTTVLLFGCIDEIDVSVPNSSEQLVVDGMITDKLGPYTVRLSRSKGFFEINERKAKFDQVEDMVQNAQVNVSDDRGNVDSFSETSPGVYTTSSTSFIGKVGVNYRLNIILENGDSYESNEELMRPNVGIKEYERYYITKKIINEFNNEVTIDGIQTTILPNRFSGNDEFYRWRWSGTYEIETFPHLRLKTVVNYSDNLHHPEDSVRLEPDPAPCSGFVTELRQQMGDLGIPTIFPLNIIKQIGPCECCQCWITETSGVPIVSTSSIGATKIFFDFFEDDNGRFGQKYHVKLQQLSLSKEAHEFWKIIEQQQNSGSLFSTSNTTVPTNIKSLNNPNEKVLGFFSATSVDEISIFLDDANLMKEPILMDSIKEDCTGLKISSAQKPTFW